MKKYICWFLCLMGLACGVPEDSDEGLQFGQLEQAMTLPCTKVGINASSIPKLGCGGPPGSGTTCLFPYSAHTDGKFRPSPTSILMNSGWSTADRNFFEAPGDTAAGWFNSQFQGTGWTVATFWQFFKNTSDYSHVGFPLQTSRMKINKGTVGNGSVSSFEEPIEKFMTASCSSTTTLSEGYGGVAKMCNLWTITIDGTKLGNWCGATNTCGIAYGNLAMRLFALSTGVPLNGANGASAVNDDYLRRDSVQHNIPSSLWQAIAAEVNQVPTCQSGGYPPGCNEFPEVLVCN